MGLTIEALVERVTTRAARANQQAPGAGDPRGGRARGHCSLDMHTGRFGFLDDGESRLQGVGGCAPCSPIRNGQVVWDSEVLSHTDWAKAGPYTNYR